MKAFQSTVDENSSKAAKKMASGIHIEYKKAILKILNEEPEMTAKKVGIYIYNNM